MSEEITDAAKVAVKREVWRVLGAVLFTIGLANFLAFRHFVKGEAISRATVAAELAATQEANRVVSSTAAPYRQSLDQYATKSAESVKRTMADEQRVRELAFRANSLAEVAKERARALEGVDELERIGRQFLRGRADLVDEVVDAIKPAVLDRELDTPIGSIVAWVSDKPADPLKWKLCNGDLLKRSDGFEILHDVIGDSFSMGRATAPGEFHLPDFRGYFLRGAGRVNPAQASNDPGEPQFDECARTHSQGRQALTAWMDENEDSFHELLGKFSEVAFAQMGIPFTELPPQARAESVALHAPYSCDALELLPVNYAVHWIIRVK